MTATSRGLGKPGQVTTIYSNGVEITPATIAGENFHRSLPAAISLQHMHSAIDDRDIDLQYLGCPAELASVNEFGSSALRAK